jgi:hypothetical protein
MKKTDSEMVEIGGILDYSLAGRDQSAITWKLTGNLGGEEYVDKVRGPLNEGGLFAERQGFTQPYPPNLSESNLSFQYIWYLVKVLVLGTREIILQIRSNSAPLLTSYVSQTGLLVIRKKVSLRQASGFIKLVSSWIFPGDMIFR